MIEIFLHMRAGEIAFVEVDPRSTVKDFGIECLGEEAFVWLEDSEAPLDPEMGLAALGVTERCHVHVSLCRKVAVKVRYAGEGIEESVSPAASADAILKWAASPEGFKLTDSEAAKHEFVLCGSETKFEPPAHIGAIADEDCSVCLDLRPKEKFAG